MSCGKFFFLFGARGRGAKLCFLKFEKGRGGKGRALLRTIGQLLECLWRGKGGVRAGPKERLIERDN